MSKYILTTRLPSLTDLPAIESDKGDAAAQKKYARIRLSLDKTSEHIGFLHACLVQIGDRAIAIVGPSGSGKSTLAQGLIEHGRGSILANDWVAVEKRDSEYYASDVNIESELKHTRSLRLDTIVLLADQDALKRDAFLPTKEDFASLLHKSFDAMTTDEADILAHFWLKNFAKLPYTCVLTTRLRPLDQTVDTLGMILQRIQPNDALIEVGIIGTGAVGSALASQLGQLPFVHKVHLYNRSKESAVGLALDLNQALYRGKHDLYVGHDAVEDVFLRSSAVFFAYREKNAPSPDPSLPERWQKVIPHAALARKYARVASQLGYTGSLYMITNPVDYLGYVCYQATQDMKHPLRTFQVYGIGLEGDMARAIYYGRRLNPRLTAKQIKLFGNHGDTFELQSNLHDTDSQELYEAVKNASNEVRSHNVRTVYGPVATAVRSYITVARGGTCSITAIQEGYYIGRRLHFKYGIPGIVETYDAEKYAGLITKNFDWIKRFANT